MENKKEHVKKVTMPHILVLFPIIIIVFSLPAPSPRPRLCPSAPGRPC